MASSGQTPAGGGAASGGIGGGGARSFGSQAELDAARTARAGGGGAGMGMVAPSAGNLAAMFAGNQGYGGGGTGVNLPAITQPTGASLGLPDITKMIPAPRQPPPQTPPTTRAPSGQEIQQRIAQMQPNGATQTYSQNGGVNAMDANSGGKAQRFADYYYRLKYQNPETAARVLENSPYKSIFAPVQVAQPQQPYQPSQAALTARRMNGERP